MSENHYQAVIERHVLDDERFVGATFSGRQRGQEVPWKKVRIRPVLIKDKRHLQFSYFDSRQDITKNYQGDAAITHLREVITLPFNTFHIRTTEGDVQIRITKKGKVSIHESAIERTKPDLSHDRRKDHPLSAKDADPFLKAVGIMTADGSIKANMQGKFNQINEFLRLMLQTGELETFDTLSIVDCGCGNAYLTFAVYHYCNHILEIPAKIMGIDVRKDLLINHDRTAASLGWTGMHFEDTTIIDFEAETPPDVVLALHACDTATDEALAQAIGWESKMIFSAPCCHHHLQEQLYQRTVSPFEPIQRHGILQERWGDILTDAFRALILRIMGYQTQVIEFVASEHTAKNLMIRAVYNPQAPRAQFVREYLALRDFWQVEPYLATLLGTVFSSLLAVD